MLVHQRRQVIATYSSPEAAGEALYALVVAGFSLAQLVLMCQTAAIPSPAAKPHLSASVVPQTVSPWMARQVKQSFVWGLLLGGGMGMLLAGAILTLTGEPSLCWGAAVLFVLLHTCIWTIAGGIAGGAIGLSQIERSLGHFQPQQPEHPYWLMIEGTAEVIERAEQVLSQLKQINH
uniref:Uncharacterized protein n=1 Tax=Cyanothece sp. (strain PCC 7425 / ATCC 29141) TaxID=395961 RepID=B8HS56_CYAP4